MSNLFFALTIAAMIAVVASLFAGLVVMTRGGTVNARYGNLLMRARVGLQGLALLFLVLAFLTR